MTKLQQVHKPKVNPQLSNHLSQQNFVKMTSFLEINNPFSLIKKTKPLQSYDGSHWIISVNLCFLPPHMIKNTFIQLSEMSLFYIERKKYLHLVS